MIFSLNKVYITNRNSTILYTFISLKHLLIKQKYFVELVRNVELFARCRMHASDEWRNILYFFYDLTHNGQKSRMLTIFCFTSLYMKVINFKYVIFKQTSEI